MKTEKCYYCERPFGVAVYGTEIVLLKTKDHVIPKSKGGNNTQTNLVPACGKCNYLKDSYLPNEFANYINNFIDCYLLFSDEFINLYPIHILERIIDNSENLHCKIEPIKSYCLKQIKAPIGFDVRPVKRLGKKPKILIDTKLSKKIIKSVEPKKKRRVKQEKNYTIPDGIVWGNILNFNGNQYSLIGLTKDGLERPIYISSSKTTVVIWHRTCGIEYEYSSVKENINHYPVKSNFDFKTWYDEQPEPNFHYE